MISIVVCTRNRSRLLQGCLNSLAKQSRSDKDYEVIVVDNNSTDDTNEIIKKFVICKNNFRAVKEYKTGLSYSRNRGWKEAKGEYVAFIDDDAEALPNWLCEIYAFIQRHPEQVAFGGPYVSFSTVSVPDWFPPEYGSKSYGSIERTIDLKFEFISGTNMVFKYTALELVGGFCHELGMKGKTISYGEETRLQLTLSELGYMVYYVPNMIVKHYIAPYKMHIRWLISSVFAHGYASVRINNQDRSLCSHLKGFAYGCCYAIKSFFNICGMPAKRKVYYSAIPLVSECGALYYYFKNKLTGINLTAENK